MEPQVFTLEAVNALVPRLAEVVGHQLELRQGIEERLQELAEEIGEVPSDLEMRTDDTPRARMLKRELVDLVPSYQEGWKQVEALGAVVKDARIGLCDFYGNIGGKLVWLCWKFGESEITHYHALDEGYDGRKAIRDTTRKLSLN